MAVTFRAGVGAAVIDARGLVLALERADVPGAWQLPQGGLEEGEEPAAAVLREVHEETGIPPEELEVLDEHPDWLVYELPAEMREPHVGRGQVQRWFLLRLRGGPGHVDPAAAPDREFDAHAWMPFAELERRVAPFRRPLYARLRERFAPWLARA